MTAEEAIDKYIEKFGGFPFFSFLSASDEYIIQIVEEALKNGKEINGSSENTNQ